MGDARADSLKVFPLVAELLNASSEPEPSSIADQEDRSGAGDRRQRRKHVVDREVPVGRKRHAGGV